MHSWSSCAQFGCGNVLALDSNNTWATMGTVLSLFLPFCLSQATSCFQFDIYSTKGHEVQSSEPLVIYQESKECYCLYVSDPIVADSRFWSQTIVLRQPNSEKSSVNKKTTSGDLWTYHPCVLTLCWPWPIVPMVQEPHRMIIRAPSVILTLSRTMIRDAMIIMVSQELSKTTIITSLH